jgi:hypothetical protein
MPTVFIKIDVTLEMNAIYTTKLKYCDCKNDTGTFAFPVACASTMQNNIKILNIL